MPPPEHQRRRPGEPLDNDESKEDSICVAMAARWLASSNAQIWPVRRADWCLALSPVVAVECSDLRACLIQPPWLTWADVEKVCCSGRAFPVVRAVTVRRPDLA